jgi:hypothetical protein
MEIQLAQRLHLSERRANKLEHHIANTEKELGIENDGDRLIEASLFIDRKFVNYALITGITDKPERIFGDNAWADYLDGRKFAVEFGNQDLTPGFILALHKKLTKRTNPKVSGEIRSSGVKGGSYDNEEEPVTLSQDQIRAIDENPLLSFKRVPPDDEDSTTGFISYPHSGKRSSIQASVEQDLEAICTWFNDAKKQESYNPHIVAGLLQQRLVSLHPFLDGNGTLSRVLMNWSLENDGVSPSVLVDPSQDILTDQETWIFQVSEGSRRYETMKKRQKAFQEAGIESISGIASLGVDKEFYDRVFRYLNVAPPLPVDGNKHSHLVYEAYLSAFDEEMAKFQEYLSSKTVVETPDGPKEVTQGGFITPEFMQFMISQNILSAPQDLRDQFFSDFEVYRGGMMDGEIDDEKICQLFSEFIGVGTGYRALRKANISATSQQVVPSHIIRESMDYFNSMLASSYLSTMHPDIPNPYTQGDDQVRLINTTVREHVSAGQSIWNSPFASTSLNAEVSRDWATKFSAPYAKDANYGVLFKVKAPREGTVMTFGADKLKALGMNSSLFEFEREVLVAGGLSPSLVVEVEIFERGVDYSNPGIAAKKLITDKETQVIIEDSREEFVTRRTYVFNPVTSRFEFSRKELTKTPSKRDPRRAGYFETGIKLSNVLDKKSEPSKSFELFPTSQLEDLFKPKPYKSPFAGTHAEKKVINYFPYNSLLENEEDKTISNLHSNFHEISKTQKISDENSLIDNLVNDLAHEENYTIYTPKYSSGKSKKY